MKTLNMPAKLIGLTAVAAFLIGVSAPALQAQSSRVSLAPGTVIPVTLNTELSSSQSQAGDTFTATVDNSKDAYNQVMHGATVDGVVRHATPQSGSSPGTLELAFTRLRLSDGTSYAISGVPASLDTKSLTTDSNGMLMAKNTKKDNRLTYTGIGAGAGVLASVLSGGKLKIEDVLLGAAAGYAAGALIKTPDQVHDVTLASGTPMGVLLNNRVLYHRTSRQNTLNAHKATRKYYTYGGHHFFLNTTTGERVQLD